MSARRTLTLIFAVIAAFSAGGTAPARACVGRTIFVGYIDTPEQVLVAHLLSVFIDERTGTTVKMTRFESREEAFGALRQDKISLYADYSGSILRRFGGDAPGPDEDANLSRLKEYLNR